MTQASAAQAAKLVAMATSANQKIATAESCTGGLIAKYITDVAGSSACFEQGFVTYANAAKSRALGVSAETLERHGAVSQPVVEQMALGAVQIAAADIAVAVSGVAGPGGGTPDKPVGTVWIAWAMGDRVAAECYYFEGDRAAVREATAAHAISGMIDRITSRS